MKRSVSLSIGTDFSAPEQPSAQITISCADGQVGLLLYWQDRQPVAHFVLHHGKPLPEALATAIRHSAGMPDIEPWQQEPTDPEAKPRLLDALEVVVPIARAWEREPCLTPGGLRLHLIARFDLAAEGIR